MNAKDQAGLTLIEVMISITLGIIFLVAAMGFLVTAQQSSQAQDSGSRIQENARFAMQIIRKSVQMAGFSQGLVKPTYIYRGPCGTVNGQTATHCSDNVSLLVAAQGDRLAVAMVPPVIPPATSPQDCLGNEVAANTRIANVFWVEVSGNTSSLYCQGYDIEKAQWIETSQPIVDGIDQMQVQYGILDTTTGHIDRYLNASVVQALGAANWQNVRTVKVGLLVNAGLDTDESRADAGTLGAQTLADNYTYFRVLDGTYIRSGDRRRRRVYTNVIAINN